MKRNHGYLPLECEIRDDRGNVTGYRRVHVRLFNGYDTIRAGADRGAAGVLQRHRAGSRLA